MREDPGGLGRTSPAVGGVAFEDEADDGTPTARTAPGERGAVSRPGRLSATAAALVAAATALVLGVAGGFAVAAALAVAGAVGVAAGVSLLAAGGVWRVVVGVTLAVAAGGVLAGAAVLGPSLALWGLWVGVFAAALFRLRPPDATVATALTVLGYGLVPVWLASFLAVLAAPLGLFGRLTAETLGASPRTSGLTTLALLVTLAVLSLRSALGVLPVVRLAPPAARARLRPLVRRTERALWVLAQFAVVAVPVAVAVEVTVLAESPALSASVARVVASPPLRAFLGGVVVLGVAVSLTALLVRWAGGSFVEHTRRGVAAATGVCLAALVAVGHAPLYSLVRRVAPPGATRLLAGLGRSPGESATTLLVVSVALILVVVTLFLLLVVTDLGVVPPRVAEPAIAATGLLAGVVFGAGLLPAPVVVGGVASALLVWDLGEYAVGVGEVVPGGASRVEAVHAAGGLGVAVAVTVLVAGAHALLTRVEPSGTASVAALAAVLVGGLALAAALR